MIFKNGYIVDEDFRLRKCDLKTEGERITLIGEKLTDDNEIDVTGMYILPGFIDTHIHGAYGTRTSDENFREKYSDMLKFEATKGVTSIAITTDNVEFSALLEQIEYIYKASLKTEGTKIAAIHAEGPFINKERKGAMNEAVLLEPDIEKFEQMLQKSHGLLKIMTVAPELEGAEDLMKYSVGKGVAVSMGHTNATYEQGKNAIEWGASLMTHTFNAARPINHREPGVIGAALMSDLVVCEMICDYVHLHPETIKMIYKLKGRDNISIISDSGTAAGLQITEFMTCGKKRYVKDGVVRLEDGTIAGSTMTVLEGVKNLISSGFDICDVSKMASYNPAKTLKLEDKIGSIGCGKVADFVVLDEKLDVQYTVIDGKVVYQKNNQI